MAEVQTFEERGCDLLVWVKETQNTVIKDAVAMVIDGGSMPSEHLVAEGLKPSYRGIIYLWQPVIGQLPDHLLQAVIDHEVGHLVAGHMVSGKERNEDGILVDVDFEIEADAYSASIHGAGTMAKALKSLAVLATKVAGAARGKVVNVGHLKKAIRHFKADPTMGPRFAALAA
jgi:Zn-dependent protease with chaperone function